jgi:hypothetical protein
MSKAPQTPQGVSTAYFGRYIMKWGRGERGATARLATITADKLQQADVTCEILTAGHEFYRNEAESRSTEPSGSSARRIDGTLPPAAQLLEE